MNRPLLIASGLLLAITFSFGIAQFSHATPNDSQSTPRLPVVIVKDPSLTSETNIDPMPPIKVRPEPSGNPKFSPWTYPVKPYFPPFHFGR